MQTYIKDEVSPLEINHFELWYQPVYDLPRGTVLHNEVLLRWRSPCGALKNPIDFMPFIFETGSEKWVDRFVLTQAINVLIQEVRAKLSINLSRVITTDYQIADFIHTLVTENHIDPQRLHLEFSEKNVAQDITGYTALLKDLKQIGCTVVLDNFSNDYLSFLQWEKLNVDFVKIRGHLIHTSTQCKQVMHLLQEIAHVGLRLGQTVVAKSIDAIHTSMFLEKLRFGPVQGYYLKPPSPRLCLTEKVDILGVPIDNISMQELLSKLDQGVVFTPNVDHLINIRRQAEFGTAYGIADYKLCDSQILYFASRFLGSPLKEKISGSDLFPAFCTYHKENLETTIFLLGGLEEAAVTAQRNINHKVGRPIVVDAYSPPLGFDNDVAECLAIVQRINQSGATVLAIGVGAPKQEKWVSRYRSHLTTVKIVFAVGATINFEAGTLRRSPEFVSALGVEWLYRLIMEPQRLWRRYLINDLPFIWLLLKQVVLGQVTRSLITASHPEKPLKSSLSSLSWKRWWPAQGHAGNSE